ncbi:HDOD domain-containing protein [Dissulfurirhabdus thermomarina]|uniref:histidine kinase n=1 Tax=Dissulfurirhabdus thermomarina TaxID=1765737 RepID=A0A6N9TQ24_DISTH|nr:HDOD domain-containing protein [Dissulfurirhabdus thermomarina]NDY43279.1 HDOD domain-containing protein [Dissulfurirhabdus thermomarina]NMX23721.1 HDOD domain-containing protein [Dissulfurirhabdus thermomarina]
MDNVIHPEGKAALRVKEVLRLSSLPHVVLRLLEATLDEDASVADIARVAGNDPGLTARMLRLANSPYFGVSRKISTIEDAAVILGLQAVRNLAVTISVYEFFSGVRDTPGFSLPVFWWHSLATAIVCRSLAEAAGYPEPSEAFMAGLLHDVGKLVILQADAAAFRSVHHGAHGDQRLVEAERAVLGMDHAAAGADFLEQSRLHPFFCDAVRYHHLSPGEVRAASGLVRIVHLGDRLAHRLPAADEAELRALAAVLDEAMGPVPVALADLRDRLEREIRRLAADLGVRVLPPEEGEGPRAADATETQARLRDRVEDLSLLVASLQSMVAATDEDQLFSALFQSLAVLFDFETVFLATVEDQGVLYGQRAFGSRRDDLARRLRIACEPGTVWEAAFEADAPVYSGDYFREHPPRVIDRQVEGLLGTAYAVIPLVANGERVGSVAAGLDPSDWDRVRRHVSLLRLLAHQMAAAVRGYRYRLKWRRERQFNDTLLEAVPVGVAVVDPQGRLLYANPEARRLLAGGPGEAPAEGGDVWRTLGADPGVWDELLARVHAAGTGEVHFRAGGGAPEALPRWFHARAANLTGFGDRGYLLVLQDVTTARQLDEERKGRSRWLREELAAKTRELEEAQAQALKAQRLATAAEVARKVAHEVNNPLGIIKNYLRLHRMKAAAPGEEATFEAINREIDRIAAIVRQLEVFSKGAPSAGQGREPAQPGSVVRALDDLALLLAEPMREKGVDLRLEVDEGLPPVQLSDDALKQVLINLIKNAEEAIEGAGTIRVRATRHPEEADRVLIEVADTGPSVDAEVKERLFDPFVTTKAGENVGLGLSVCYGLVTGAGGRIQLKETPGAGAVFEIVLPAAASGR